MSTIGATAFTLPAYDESTLKEIAAFQARAAKLLDFLRQKAEREPEWAAHHDNGKWGHCEQMKNYRPTRTSAPLRYARSAGPSTRACAKT